MRFIFLIIFFVAAFVFYKSFYKPNDSNQTLINNLAYNDMLLVKNQFFEEREKLMADYRFLIIEDSNNIDFYCTQLKHIDSIELLFKNLENQIIEFQFNLCDGGSGCFSELNKAKTILFKHQIELYKFIQ